jgi:hypothetical protein
MLQDMARFDLPDAIVVPRLGRLLQIHQLIRFLKRPLVDVETNGFLVKAATQIQANFVASCFCKIPATVLPAFHSLAAA